MTDTQIDLLFLSEPEMIEAGVTDVAACVDVMEETLRLLSAGDARLGGKNSDSHGLGVTFPDTSKFPTMPLNGPDRRFMALPAYIGGTFHMAGVKWYGSNVENKSRDLPRSIHTIVLSDPDTAAPTAIMAGNLVSAYRTAAVPASAARVFAPDDAEIIAIAGPGVMNMTALEAFLAVRPSLKRIQILGRSEGSTQKYVAFVREKFPQLTDVVIVESLEQALRGADIVSVAVTSAKGIPNYPVLKEEWIKPGAFLSLPGAARFEDEFLAERAFKVVDYKEMFQNFAAELPYPVHNGISLMGMQLVDLVTDGKISWEDVINIGDIFGGTVTPEKSSEQVTVFPSGGLPVEDVSWATRVYRNALAKGIGTSLNYWEEPLLR